MLLIAHGDIQRARLRTGRGRAGALAVVQTFEGKNVPVPAGCDPRLLEEAVLETVGPFLTVQASSSKPVVEFCRERTGEDNFMPASAMLDALMEAGACLMGAGRETRPRFFPAFSFS